MARLRVTIPDELLERARLTALEQGTTLEALVRTWLESLAGAGTREPAAIQRLLDLASRTNAGRGGVAASRDDLHER